MPITASACSLTTAAREPWPPTSDRGGGGTRARAQGRGRAKSTDSRCRRGAAPRTVWGPREEFVVGDGSVVVR
eukprot:7461620-Alexandrium_andersonii.AAC.1